MYLEKSEYNRFNQYASGKIICIDCRSPYYVSAHIKNYINGTYVGCTNNKKYFPQKNIIYSNISYKCEKCSNNMYQHDKILIHNQIYILGKYVCCVDNNKNILNQNINEKDKGGNTLLHNIIWYSSDVNIHNLLVKGAIQTKNNKNITPLDLAIKQKHLTNVDLLISYNGLKDKPKILTDKEYNEEGNNELMKQINDYVSDETLSDFINKIKKQYHLH